MYRPGFNYIKDGVMLTDDQIIELLVDRVVVKDTELEIRYVIPTRSSSEHVHFLSLGAITGNWEVYFFSHEFIHYFKISLNYLLLVKILLNKRSPVLAHG